MLAVIPDLTKVAQRPPCGATGQLSHKSKPWNWRWLRQGSAALVYFVMLGINAEANFDRSTLGVSRLTGVERVTEYPVDEGTKFCSANRRVFKAIPVSNGAPNIEEFFTLSDFQQVLISNCRRTSTNGLLWTKNGCARFPFKEEIKIRRQRRVPEFVINIDFGIDGRSISKILDDGSDVIPIFPNSEIYHANNGALRDDQSAFGDLDGLLCGFGGFVGALVGSIKKNTLNGTNHNQQKGEDRQKAVSDFQPRSKNIEGPVFASLISAFLGILISLPLGIAGGLLLLNGRWLAGGICVVVALCVAFSSTVGLLIGMDLWSLWRRFQ